MEGKNYFRYLLERYMNDSASVQERNDLFEELRRNEDTRDWEALINEFLEEAEEDEKYEESRWNYMADTVLKYRKDTSARKWPGWWRWAAAAAILIMVGMATAVFFADTKRNGSSTQVAANSDVPAPSYTKAYITLSDGRKVSLDSLSSGLLADESGTRLVKIGEGQVAYETIGTQDSDQVPYNTLNNPRGNKVIDIMLSDGSRVWLNAGSSITYPVVFPGNERQVRIYGEAYFEVARDAHKPFSVIKESLKITVLGTRFNVNAYAEEPNSTVTLLEGSVQVGNQFSRVAINPGQQAVDKGQQSLSIIKQVDTEAVMAWKNGYFQFNFTPLEEGLRQLERWYDIEVAYENGVPDIELWGEMKRDLSLSQALRGLGKIGVRFRIEGRKLIVTGSGAP